MNAEGYSLLSEDYEMSNRNESGEKLKPFEKR